MNISIADSDKIAIAGIVVNTVIAIVGWVILIWANKKTIQATLQAAQPVAPAASKEIVRKRKKVFGYKQRRVLKVLRWSRFFTLFLIICSAADLRLFYHPANLTLVDILLALSFVAIVATSARALLLSRRLRQQIESGNRAVIDDLYKLFPPRTKSSK